MDTEKRTLIIKAFVWLAIIFGVAAWAVSATDNTYTEAHLKVEAADHERDEGYFHVGKHYIMVEPGSELHLFLMRARGGYINISLDERPDEPKRIER